jgi:hypothetical protein
MMSRSKGHSTARKQKSPLKLLVRLTIFAMVVSALTKELSKPAAERTWHGEVWRFVPYDFRVPTWARLRDSLWAPDNPHLFTDRVFGVGWNVNFGRIYSVLKSIAQPPS